MQLLALVTLVTPALCAEGSVDTLHMAWGDGGLESLRYAGTEILANGSISVPQATLTGANGMTAAAPVVSTRMVTNPHARKITQVYPWGAVSCTYQVRDGSRLYLTIGIRNDSDSTLSGIAIQLMEVNFPEPPQGWVKDYAYFGDNRGNPTILPAHFGTGTLVACNEDLEPPLLFGFPGRASLVRRPLWLCTANVPRHLSPYLDPYLKNPIPPHRAALFHLSLRFGPSTATVNELCSDIYRRFATTYPATLDWKDRRPIGTLHLSASETRLHSATNPRGWFADPMSVDVLTPAGIAAFHRRVLKYATDSVAILKSMNAQGMVTWDIEGQEFPHATSYIGDPRLLHTLDPEMDSIADAYFRIFREAGLRTGVCIRPQQLHYSAGQAQQVENTDPARIVATLYDRITYAHRRWGCTLFYIDSNGDPKVPYDPAIFESLTRQLQREKITVLLMPEHRNLRYYACTAPYADLRHGLTGTQQAIRAVYPHAFLAEYVPDGPLSENRDKLTAAVRQGDILLFRAWWNDPANAEVRHIYQASKESKP